MLEITLDSILDKLNTACENNKGIELNNEEVKVLVYSLNDLLNSVEEFSLAIDDLASNS